MNNLKTKILETVHHNNIQMTPKWKFALYSSLGVISIIFAFLVVIFIISLVLFVFSKYGLMDMSFFGFVHIVNMLRAIPILLLLCTIVLLVLIEVLSQQYAFAFRRPLAVTLLAGTSIIVVISFFISQTPLHSYIRDYMKSNNFEMGARAYERPNMLFAGNGMEVLRGEVVGISPTSTMLELFDGTMVVAYPLQSGTNTPHQQNLNIGDDVVLLGTFVGSSSGKFEVSRYRPTRKMFPEKLHDGPRPHHKKNNSDPSANNQKTSYGKTIMKEEVK